MDEEQKVSQSITVRFEVGDVESGQLEALSERVGHSVFLLTEDLSDD